MRTRSNLKPEATQLNTWFQYAWIITTAVNVKAGDCETCMRGEANRDDRRVKGAIPEVARK